MSPPRNKATDPLVLLLVVLVVLAASPSRADNLGPEVGLKLLEARLQPWLGREASGWPWRRQVARLQSSMSADLGPQTAASGNQSEPVLRLHATAIHVDEAEFPLSKLLFKLTLELAMQALEKRLEQRKVKLTLSVRQANTCSRQYASALAAEEYHLRGSRLFILSGCDSAIRGVARLANTWRVPVMTAAGFGADLNNKSIYRTLIRIAFSLQNAVEFLLKILKSFQWQRVNLIVDESDENSLALKEGIEKHIVEAKITDFQLELNVVSLDLAALRKPASSNSSADGNYNNNNQYDYEDDNDNYAGVGSAANLVRFDSEDKWPNELTDTAIRDALRQSSLFSRVNILLLPQRYLRKFMLSVYDQGMANGLYTFINMPLLLITSGDQLVETTAGTNDSKQSYSASMADNVFVWRSLQSTRNGHAKQAFESLMSIYLRSPTGKAYVYFTGKLLNLANDQFATTTTPSPLLAKPDIPARNKLQPVASDGGQAAGGAKIQLSVNPYTASFYDCLHLYVSALEESMDAIGRAPNEELRLRLQASLHANISVLLRKRRFENMVTGTIHLNELGDRESDFTLDDMNELTGKFSPVMIYRGDTRNIERLARIHWSSDESVGPTVDDVDCRLSNTCARKPLPKFLVTLFMLAAPIVLIMSLLLYFVYSRISLESQLVDYWWKISMKDVEMVSTRRKQAGEVASDLGGSQVSSIAPQSASLMHRTPTSISDHVDPSHKAGFSSELGKTVITGVTGTSAYSTTAADVCYGNISLGIYKLAKVALKPMAKFSQSRKLMIELRTSLANTTSICSSYYRSKLKNIEHNNLCKFIGIVVDEANTAFVSEFCPKGSLREFFQNESMVIDWTFKYSIINDIMAGLTYIQSSALDFHGRLKSSNCLVSSRFVIKLSDYGLGSLHEQLDDYEDDAVLMRKQLWRAPELLKSGAKRASKKGDVYSFGLLLHEIITNTIPFFNPEIDDYVMPLKALLSELKEHGPNERIGPDMSAVNAVEENIGPLVEIMQECWQYDPNKRPTLAEVAQGVKKITHGVTSKKLLENLMSRMEQYTNNLESLVDAKLATLVEEKIKTEELLYQFVPQSIASRLKEGEIVEPEAFDCVTVLFSDIVGFTSLSAESTPIQVIDFLSNLYLCFDECLQQYDIFKVETIGDAYIVASGLPQRNEGNHVIEIAQAALELRDRIAKFKIPHLPSKKLQMRVGIHSGPCIAGIVGGVNMPKYCVFGDTLSFGKFMESSGLPMKVHITEDSKNLLERIGGFRIETRTPKISRDGIPFQSYWLERK